MLHFGSGIPFTFNAFLDKCDGIISESDIEIIKSLQSIDRTDYDTTHPTLRKWRAFDRTLRNELAVIRASRKHVDPARYLRKDGSGEQSVKTIAMNAYKNPSILESEKLLDEARWQALNELTIGHYFDIDFLLAYAQKLLILEKWERINTANKTQALEEIVSSGK